MNNTYNSLSVKKKAPILRHGSISSSSQPSLQSNQSDSLLDHSHLKPGNNASLLSYDKTIHMYRQNALKSNNMDTQCDFAIFLIKASKDQQEAEKILKQVSMRGHSEAQYYLATLYVSRSRFDKAFPLFVQASKHHHSDAAFRAAKCYEDGLGTKKDKSKAAQYYRKAATLNHPGAMYRFGLAEMKGELGLSRNVRDGHTWLKRSAEAATRHYPHALHTLASLHEQGYDAVIFADHRYAVRLYHEAALLGHAPSAHRLGTCYDVGDLGCPVDPARSIHYYRIAADQHFPASCFALAAWYLVGVPEVLEPSDDEAYAWARVAAEHHLPKAIYAVAYFTETGIGTSKDDQLALVWYKKAADLGDKRAIQRLTSSTTTALSTTSSRHRLMLLQRAASFLFKK